MDTTELQARIDRMPAALNAKGKREPSVVASFNANATPHVMLSWTRTAADPEPIFGSTTVNQYLTGEDVGALLDNADRIIADLPSIEDARMAEFTNMLAKTIEMGNQHGIDVQFVNPLTEAMKRLSENALTHQ